MRPVCGIFGARLSWLRSAGLDPERAAAAALLRLGWRGRDGAGWVAHGDFVLGCARLSITERRSRQPLCARGGRHAGVLNGAITSARAVWRGLRPRIAARAALPNDAWLPVLLCAAGREAELAGLHGHHALAVVDAGRDRLVLARDAMGEKPLLVALAGGRPVAFASTAPALAELGVAAGLPPEGISRLFTFGIAGAPVALGGRLVLAAALAGVHAAAGEGPLECVAAPVVGEVPAGAAPLAAAVARAVGRCADVAEPVALSLSGGIDSSCLAAELGAVRPGATAWQFRAEGEPEDERRSAAAVARHCGLELRPVDGGAEVLEALPALTRWHGLPLGDPSVLALHALARAAARDGVRVLLSGEGADELLLGYARHRAARLLPRRGLAGLPAPRWSMARAARAARALGARDPYAELLAVTPPAFRATVLAAGIAREALPAARALPANGGRERHRDRLERARAVDLSFYLRWDLLPKLDVATLAAGIEGRCPFLDAGVRAAADALPARTALGKRPLRRAYADRLPAAVLAQRKRGLLLPLDRWFRGELPWLDLLRQERTRTRPHLRPAGLDRAIDRHRSGAADLGHALYLLVACELWLRAGEDAAGGATAGPEQAPWR